MVPEAKRITEINNTSKKFVSKRIVKIRLKVDSSAHCVGKKVLNFDEKSFLIIFRFYLS